jgi:hypothetical protein
MVTVDALRNQALQLAPEDRALLARDLLLSLETGDFDDDAESAWTAEIQSRAAAIAAGVYSASESRESLQRLRDDLKQTRQA